MQVSPIRFASVKANIAEIQPNSILIGLSLDGVELQEAHQNFPLLANMDYLNLFYAQKDQYPAAPGEVGYSFLGQQFQNIQNAACLEKLLSFLQKAIPSPSVSQTDLNTARTQYLAHCQQHAKAQQWTVTNCK